MNMCIYVCTFFIFRVFSCMDVLISEKDYVPKSKKYGDTSPKNQGPQIQMPFYGQPIGYPQGHVMDLLGKMSARMENLAG